VYPTRSRRRTTDPATGGGRELEEKGQPPARPQEAAAARRSWPPRSTPLPWVLGATRGGGGAEFGNPGGGCLGGGGGGRGGRGRGGLLDAAVGVAACRSRPRGCSVLRTARGEGGVKGIAVGSLAFLPEVFFFYNFVYI